MEKELRDGCYHKKLDINILTDIKKNILSMAHYSHASHVGSALSVVDILYVLYFKVANINKENINSLDRDKIILSKGHASTALYSVLSAKGLLNPACLTQYYIDGGKLPGHLDKDSTAGVDASAGSLGHGLSLGLGIAIANSSHSVYVVLGDGECDEGSIWEAVSLASALNIKNLTAIVDNNNLQGFGHASEISGGNLADKFKSFGWMVCEEDGHNLIALERALCKPTSKPKVVIAHTIKGHGVGFMENELKWHYKSPTDQELKQAFCDLEKENSNEK